jgi:hypothetical protein
MRSGSVNYLQGEVLDKKIGYWKEKLQGVSPLQLPTDYGRPAVQSMRGATKEFRLDKELSEQLQELSQQLGTNLFYDNACGLQRCFFIAIAARRIFVLELLL